MGENLDAGDRLAVRTPMQWTSSRNAGFSTAKPSRLISAVVDGAFGPEHVNVGDQRRDPDSLLNFMTLLIRRYRQSPELGWSDFELVDQPHQEVITHRCSWGDGSMVAIHNLGPEPRTVPITLADCDDSCRLVDLLEDGVTDLDANGAASLPLAGYGYRWLRVVRPEDRRVH